MDKYFVTSEISKLLNPRQISKFNLKHTKAIENLYPSKKKAPLGHAPTPNIPCKSISMKFGVCTPKDLSVKDLMYPFEAKVDRSVYSEAFRFEKSTESSRPAGRDLNHGDYSGEQAKELLNPDRNKHSTLILPSSYAKKKPPGFLQDNLQGSGFPSHPISEENIETETKKSLRSKMDQNCLELLWNLIKVKNHENFADLVSAFQAYKSGSEKISLSNLQQMCQKFGISAPSHVVEKLIEKCDIIDKDGAISFEEFVHCLNWKDLMPENFNFKKSKYENDWREGINNPPENVIDFYRTTSSVIGDHEHSVSSRKAGLPSYNKEIDRSSLKGVSEFREYGDGPSAIQPNAFLQHGVFEEDLRKLYSKEQIKSILDASGVRVSYPAFEVAWERAECGGKSSLGHVWHLLKNECLSNCRHF